MGQIRSPGNHVSPGTGEGRAWPPTNRPCSTFLCPQIPTEEPEDEPPSGEEQAGSRLGTRDAAAGNKSNGAVSEGTEGDGQRDGEDAEPVQMVTKQLCGGGDDRDVRCGGEVSYLPVSVCAEGLCGDRLRM